jgi:hypothetical protein
MEREEPDVTRPEPGGDRQCAVEATQVLVEVVVDGDLADRGRHRRDAHAGRRQRAAHPLQLRVVQIEDTRVPRAAKLDPTDAQLRQQPALDVEIRRDLVGEPGERPHAR